MRSIRYRLLVHSMCWVLPLIVVGCTVLYFTVHYVLVSEFDASLRAQGGALASTCERIGRAIHIDFDAEAMPDFLARRNPQYFEVWTSDGRVVSRSPSLGDAHLGMVDPDREEAGIEEVILPDGRRGRAFGIPFEPRAADPQDIPEEPHAAYDASPGPIYLVIARGTQGIDRPLGVLAVALAGVCVTMVSMIALAIRSSVRTGLSPLDHMGQRVLEIDPSRLSERLNVSPLPRELKPIAARINDLLGRLQGDFERQRRFTSDAAHELRTPIAELRTLAEVALRTSRSEESQAEVLREVVDVASKLEKTIAALLGIARAKAGLAGVQTTLADVGRIVTEQWRRRSSAAEVKELVVRTTIVPSLWVESDPAIIGLMVGNLFDNAIQYTPPGGAVEIDAEPLGESVRIRIQNSGSEIEPGDLRNVFEPFWRKNHVSSESGNSGLGLALVRALGEALGIKAWAHVPIPGVFQICIQIPGSPALSRRGDARGIEHVLVEPSLASVRR